MALESYFLPMEKDTNVEKKLILLTVRISERTNVILEMLAKSRDCPVAEIVRDALNFYLSVVPRKDIGAAYERLAQTRANFRHKRDGSQAD
jgi:hypothetical protein